MSDPPTSAAPRPIFAPLTVWLLVQLAALALAAAQLPLSAHFIKPAEALAIQEMLIIQFAASSMLFPFLLRDARHCVAMILTSAPMLQLAAMLSSTATPLLIGAWTCLAIWLAALTLWRAALPPRVCHLAVAMANLISVGGLILWYLSREFGQTIGMVRFFPLVATIRFVSGHELPLVPLASTGFAAVFGIIAIALLRLRSTSTS